MTKEKRLFRLSIIILTFSIVVSAYNVYLTVAKENRKISLGVTLDIASLSYFQGCYRQKVKTREACGEEASAYLKEVYDKL
jgi:hypothetical protein